VNAGSPPCVPDFPRDPKDAPFLAAALAARADFLITGDNDLLQAGASSDALSLGVAAWMRYVTGIDEQGQPIDVRDPLRDELRSRADAAGMDAPRLAAALLGFEEIFGRDLPADRHFTAAVTAALDSLIRHGSRRTYETFGSTHP